MHLLLGQTPPVHHHFGVGLELGCVMLNPVPHAVVVKGYGATFVIHDPSFNHLPSLAAKDQPIQSTSNHSTVSITSKNGKFVSNFEIIFGEPVCRASVAPRARLVIGLLATAARAGFPTGGGKWRYTIPRK